MRLRAVWAALITVLLTVAVGCANRGQLTSDGGRTTIKLASSITGSSFLAVTAGIQEGIFAKHGVDIEVIRVKSTAEGTAAVTSGQANIAAMLTEGVIASRASGSDLKIIANLLTEDQHILYTKPEIQSIAQLVGRRLAVVGPGSGTEILAKALLERSGLDPAAVQYIPSGSASTQMAALIAGQVDGAGLVPPYDLTAANSGSRKIVEYRDILPNLTPQVFAASERTLTGNPDAIRSFVSGYKESAQWVIDHPEDAIRILMADSQIDYAASKDAYDFAKPDYSTDGLVDENGLRTWLELTRKFGAIKNELPTVDDLYDPSYAQAAP